MKKTIAFIALIALAVSACAVTFSDVAANATTTKANITWTTDVNCSSKLAYGTTTAYGKSASISKKTLSHSLQISGLTANTIYHYRLMCQVNSSYTENSTGYTFTTGQAFPDLLITKVTATPNATTLDKNVTAKAYVKNAGDAKAQNVLVKFTCANGVTQTKTVASISAGGSSTVSVSCPPPAAAGTYQILADVDPADAISESNEGNNLGNVTLNYATTPKPELAISDGDITHEFKESSGTLKVTLKIYVNNTGAAKATNVKVKVQSEGTSQVKTIGSIAAGGRGVVSITLPAAGNTQFTVTVDPDNAIAEADEGNNIATHTASAGEVMPDLVITGVTHSPSAAKSGGTVTVTAKVKNIGPATARNVVVQFQLVENAAEYTDTEQGSHEEEIIPDAGHGLLIEDIIRRRERETTITGPVLGKVSIPSIPPNTEKTARISFQIPLATPSMLIAVTADPGNKISESSETNNMATHGISVDLLYPELAINSSGIIFGPASPTVGDRVAVKATVRNAGALNAENVTVAFYVSEGGEPFSSFANVTVRKINAKTNTQVTANWTVPSGVQYATFLVRVDPLNAIPEMNKTNNEAQKNLTIFLPDLELSGNDISVTGNVAVGSQVTIKANVSNIGTAKAQRAVIRFYDRHPSDGEVFIGEKNATLNPGGTTTATVTWTVPAGISANPVIIVRANGDEAIYESDFSNNEGTLALNARLPDLSVSMATGPRHPIVPNQNWHPRSMHVDVTVRNGGTERAQNILVRVLANGAAWKEQTLSSLNAGANGTLRFEYDLNTSTPPGDYTFNAIVDPNNAITEITDDNNAAQITAHAYANQPPNAVINQSKTSAVKREMVQFSCERSIDPDYPDFSWFNCDWKFDGVSRDADGYTFSGQVYDYAFTTSGTHSIEAFVYDSDGGNDTATSTIYIEPNRPPVVELQDPINMYTNVEGTIPVSAYDPDGSIVTMIWNFGDGQTANTGPEGASHTYSSTGTRTLTCTVTDDSGAVATDTATVTVANPPPMRTVTGEKVFYAHLHVYRPGEGCPCAAVWYAFHKVIYEIKYTDDHVIHQIKYTLRTGPAFIDAVSDADEYTMFQEITAASGYGGTALQVYGVAIRDANQHTVWEQSGGPHLSASETPVTVTLTGLNIPVEVWDGTKYLVVKSDIQFPAQMCADDGSPCQDYWALVPFN